MRVEGVWNEIISRVWDPKHPVKDHTWEQGMLPPQAVAGPKVVPIRTDSRAARDDGAL